MHFSKAERAANGKFARSEASRSSHAVWEPPADRRGPVEVLQAQATTRVPELVPIRYGRMLVSPFTFYRGAAAVMAADLAGTPTSGLRAQLCGDAHLSNFGGFGPPDRELVVDINDFDETLPGPWEWDVKRLAVSFAVAGRDRGFDEVERRDIIVAAVREYREAMRRFAQMRNLDVGTPGSTSQRFASAGARRRLASGQSTLRRRSARPMPRTVSGRCRSSRAVLRASCASSAIRR